MLACLAMASWVALLMSGECTVAKPEASSASDLACTSCKLGMSHPLVATDCSQRKQLSTSLLLLQDIKTHDWLCTDGPSWGSPTLWLPQTAGRAAFVNRFAHCTCHYNLSKTAGRATTVNRFAHCRCHYKLSQHMMSGMLTAQAGPQAGKLAWDCTYLTLREDN